MGCSPCEQKRREREAATLASANETSLTINMINGCGYDISQLSKWKEVLDCAYTTSKLEAVQINEELYGTYIGILNYTIEHISETCIYANELSIILNATHVLVVLGC